MYVQTPNIKNIKTICMKFDHHQSRSTRNASAAISFDIGIDMIYHEQGFEGIQHATKRKAYILRKEIK